MLLYLIICILGSIWGLFIGLIPIAGVTTALLSVYSLSQYFYNDHYLLVCFLMSIVVSCSIGDSLASVILGVPGAVSTAACIFDGHPMIRNGKASIAVSIVNYDSIINTCLWAIVGFLFIPFYGNFILWFNTPEILSLFIFSFSLIAFVNNNNKFPQLILSLLLVLFLIYIGHNPITYENRITFGFDYLKNGIPEFFVLSAFIGLPDIISYVLKKEHKNKEYIIVKNNKRQEKTGRLLVLKYWKDSIIGGFVGFITGLMPGIGGILGDLIAYKFTVFRHKNMDFGKGNPIGLIGCEGANNAQKVSSLIPLLLFGIPAAPFATIVMVILNNNNFTVGGLQTIHDYHLIYMILGTFIVSTFVTVLMINLLKNRIFEIYNLPKQLILITILSIITYNIFQYTGSINDIILFYVLLGLGYGSLLIKLDRLLIVIIFVLHTRIETYISQVYNLYSLEDLFAHHKMFIFSVLMFMFVLFYSFINSIFKRVKYEF